MRRTLCGVKEEEEEENTKSTCRANNIIFENRRMMIRRVGRIPSLCCTSILLFVLICSQTFAACHAAAVIAYDDHHTTRTNDDQQEPYHSRIRSVVRKGGAEVVDSDSGSTAGDWMFNNRYSKVRKLRNQQEQQQLQQQQRVRLLENDPEDYYDTSSPTISAFTTTSEHYAGELGVEVDGPVPTPAPTTPRPSTAKPTREPDFELLQAETAPPTTPVLDGDPSEPDPAEITQVETPPPTVLGVMPDPSATPEPEVPVEPDVSTPAPTPAPAPIEPEPVSVGEEVVVTDPPAPPPTPRPTLPPETPQPVQVSTPQPVAPTPPPVQATPAPTIPEPEVESENGFGNPIGSRPTNQQRPTTPAPEPDSVPTEPPEVDVPVATDAPEVDVPVATDAPVPAPTEPPVEGPQDTPPPTMTPGISGTSPTPGPTVDAPTTSGGDGGDGGGIAGTPQVTMHQILNISAFYFGVGTSLDQEQIDQLILETELWFMQTYNNRSYVETDIGDSANRRLLGSSPSSLLQHRKLQQFSQQPNPATLGVQWNMYTRISYVAQAPASAAENENNNNDLGIGVGGVEFIYNQYIEYSAPPVVMAQYPPESLILLPYAFPPTNAIYGYTLQIRVIGFESLQTPIQLPQVPLPVPTPTPTQAPTTVSSNDQPDSGGGEGGDGLSTGAIIGIAVGGGVALIAVFLLMYCLCCKKRSDDSSSGKRKPGSKSESHTQPSATNTNTLPFQLNVMNTGDEVSVLEDPTRVGPHGDAGSVDYEPSVATYDYDYSKAYNVGAGNASVVSSVGGTLGDNTRHTAGGETAAVRAALGASFDADDAAGENEKIIEVNAPAGKLGLVIDTPGDGTPIVYAVKDSSPIVNEVRIDDKLVAVDGEDVRKMTAMEVSKLLSKKSGNPSRKLTILRSNYGNPSG